MHTDIHIHAVLLQMTVGLGLILVFCAFYSCHFVCVRVSLLFFYNFFSVDYLSYTSATDSNQLRWYMTNNQQKKQQPSRTFCSILTSRAYCILILSYRCSSYVRLRWRKVVAVISERVSILFIDVMIRTMHNNAHNDMQTHTNSSYRWLDWI